MATSPTPSAEAEGPRDAPAADPGDERFFAALGEAIGLLRAEQLEQAEAALRALQAQRPRQPDVLHFLGIVRHLAGRSGEGIALIEQALAAAPGEPGLWNNLGNVLLESRRVDEARQAYQRSVEAAGDGPAAADALNNLGTIHRKQGRLAEAEAACREAIARRPDAGDAWYNLSLTLMDQHRIHEGLVASSRAIALWPRHLQGRNQVIRALMVLGERDEAARLYREWLAEDPGNPVALHQLAACLDEQAPPRASDAYVQQVFDSFAASFDAKLEALDYRAPSLVARALQAVLPPPAAALDIADLGCGTGLCGPLLRPWARRLAGCDLSVGMLRQARQRGAYDVLHQAELVYYLATQPGAFDVLVSADTLCYFGALDEMAAAAAQALRPGGWLAFTVEALPDDDDAPHRLQLNGRYAHRASYLRQVLADAGLREAAPQACTLRQEAGQPVRGWLVRVRRP